MVKEEFLWKWWKGSIWLLTRPFQHKTSPWKPMERNQKTFVTWVMK